MLLDRVLDLDDGFMPPILDVGHHGLDAGLQLAEFRFGQRAAVLFGAGEQAAELIADFGDLGLQGGEIGVGRCAGGGSCHDKTPVCLVRSEEHTSELQSLMRISYAVFCLKKKNKTNRD